MKNKSEGLYDTWAWCSIAAVVSGIAYPIHGKIPWTFAGRPASPAKPYRSLSTFYPYYKTEHTHPVSRALHVMGTTLVMAMLSSQRYRAYVPNLVISMATGTMLSEFLVPFETGLLEAASMALAFSGVCGMRRQRVPIEIAVVGYAFAWVGHFFFEKNRPATFVYPSYSLASDFIMWFQTITGTYHSA